LNQSAKVDEGAKSPALWEPVVALLRRDCVHEDAVALVVDGDWRTRLTISPLLAA
jgi:hypothetical protein